jgi:hypothetical protein
MLEGDQIMTVPGDKDYKTRLGEVLRRQDPAELHLFLRQSAAHFGDDRQVAEVEERSHEEMEELMHRMILARPDLSDLHDNSRSWLAGRSPSQQGPAPRRAPDSAGRPRRRPGRSREN